MEGIEEETKAVTPVFQQPRQRLQPTAARRKRAYLAEDLAAEDENDYRRQRQRVLDQLESAALIQQLSRDVIQQQQTQLQSVEQELKQAQTQLAQARDSGSASAAQVTQLNQDIDALRGERGALQNQLRQAEDAQAANQLQLNQLQSEFVQLSRLEVALAFNDRWLTGTLDQPGNEDLLNPETFQQTLGKAADEDAHVATPNEFVDPQWLKDVNTIRSQYELPAPTVLSYEHFVALTQTLIQSLSQLEQLAPPLYTRLLQILANVEPISVSARQRQGEFYSNPAQYLLRGRYNVDVTALRDQPAVSQQFLSQLDPWFATLFLRLNLPQTYSPDEAGTVARAVANPNQRLVLVNSLRNLFLMDDLRQEQLNIERLQAAADRLRNQVLDWLPWLSQQTDDSGDSSTTNNNNNITQMTTRTLLRNQYNRIIEELTAALERRALMFHLTNRLPDLARLLLSYEAVG
jgi:hypothetical protein